MYLAFCDSLPHHKVSKYLTTERCNVKLPFEIDRGIGTSATLGLIVLQDDETLEHEMALLLHSEGVALYHSRIPMVPEITSATLHKMESELPLAIAMLPSAAEFDVIGFGCTSGATIIGADNVTAAVRKVRPAAKVTNPITAVMAACDALKVKRLGFVTPYVEQVSAAMRALLEGNGYKIAGFGSFEESDDRVVARISPQSLLQAITAVDAMAECDAVFVSCTNLRVIGIVEEAERRIGKPVISSNIALAWHMQELAGLRPTNNNCGALLRLQV